MKRKWPWLAAVAAIIVGGLAWYSLRKEDDIQIAGGERPIIVQLQWTPGAQFLGFYVAKAKGFYAEENLSVEFAHGGPEVNPIQQVLSNNAAIGLATADQVLLWSHKQADNADQLRALGTVFNRSLARFMSKSDAGIRTPSDLKGKTVGIFPTYDTESLLDGLLLKAGLSESDVTKINYPSYVNFVQGSVDVYGSYLINEPVVAEADGIKVNLIDPQEFGLRFYSDTIIAKASYVADHRKAVSAFLKASARGWEYAASNPDESLDLMYAVIGVALGPGKPRMLQEKMIPVVLSQIRDPQSGRMFVMEKARWIEMEQTLATLGVFSLPSTVDRLCDFGFAPDAVGVSK